MKNKRLLVYIFVCLTTILGLGSMPLQAEKTKKEKPAKKVDCSNWNACLDKCRDTYCTGTTCEPGDKYYACISGCSDNAPTECVNGH